MSQTLTGPYNVYDTITPSNTVDFFRGPCDAIYVGGAGIVVAIDSNDQTRNFTCVAGQILPIKAKRVNSTTTTATLMLALYYV